MQHDRIDELERRLQQLERPRRRRPFAAGALAGLGLAFLVSLRPVPEDVVEAQAFHLYDAEGRRRAELGVRDDGSVGLFVLDEEERTRVSLIHDADQTGLFLRDAEDTIRVGVAQFAHGGGGVALHGPELKGAAVLYLKGDGSLTFFDAEGGVTAKLPAEKR